MNEIDDDFDPTDPFQRLRPVLAGQRPPGDAGSWEVNDGVVLRPVQSHRNLWSLEVCGVSVVTLDADDFTTTADLGFYIKRLFEQLHVEAEVDSADEEDPRETDRRPSFQ